MMKMMMIGSEPYIDVILGKNKIAKITLINDQLVWQYDQIWQQSGYAVSPYLPLKGEIPTLNTQRFLRNFLPEGNALDELITYFRLSKSNTFGLVRALGLDIPGALIIVSPEQRVEKKPKHIRDGASYAKLFDFANQCINPALTKDQMLDWALFNLLICNYDAHGKNISFFVDRKGISLAPFYDLVNIKMYPDFAQEMAMAFGDK